MRLGIDQAPVANMDNLIDAVGELISPVLNMNLSMGMGQVAPIHIGYARHQEFLRREPGGIMSVEIATGGAASDLALVNPIA
jgi:hypothetical protein